MRLLSLVPAAVICAVAVMACSDTPDPNDPSNFNPNAGYGAQYGVPTGTAPGAYPPGAYPTATAPGAYPTATTPGAYPTATAPPPQPTAPAGGGGRATPLNPALTGIAQAGLQAMAAQHVRGLRPDGAAFAAQFQAGQTFEQPFTLQPGRCYAVVAQGVGITELDVQLVLHQPPLPPAVLSKDSTTGAQAMIPGNKCYQHMLPMPTPAKIVVRATAGQGMAIAQLYSR